jgi:hypothetical protein
MTQQVVQVVRSRLQCVQVVASCCKLHSGNYTIVQTVVTCCCHVDVIWLLQDTSSLCQDTSSLCLMSGYIITVSDVQLVLKLPVGNGQLVLV